VCSDIAKAVMIILIADTLLGYHSEEGWTGLIELVSKMFPFFIMLRDRACFFPSCANDSHTHTHTHAHAHTHVIMRTHAHTHAHMHTQDGCVIVCVCRCWGTMGLRQTKKAWSSL